MTPMSKRNDRPFKRRAGFTLVEMMVALSIGTVVVAAVFTIGGGSAHHFQEQQRVGVLQRSVREASDRIRRDIGRAGYLSVASTLSPRVSMCRTPATPRTVQAIWLDDTDSTAASALAAINGGQNGVSADRLRLSGNYATSDAYLVRSINNTGTMLWLQTQNWQAFQRSFVVTTAGGQVVDTAGYLNAFRRGRMLHIETRTHQHFLVDITGSSIDSGGTSATVSISPGLGNNNPCIEGLLEGAVVAPVSQIEYALEPAPAGSNLAPRSLAVTGPNTQLVRREIDMTSGTEMAGTRRVVLDYAVDFNVELIIDTNLTPTNPPSLVRRAGAQAEASAQGSPWQVRSAIVSIAGRSATQDSRFPWPTTWASGRPSGAPLNRYRVFSDRQGAARVRSLTTEIVMPNLVPR